MKINEAYKLREIAGEYLIIKQGNSHTDMTKVISLNDTARLLWGELTGKDLSVDKLAEMLVNNYNITKDEALNDVQKWVESMKEYGIIE